MPKPRPNLNFAVNKFKVRIPWLIELEGEGVIPVVGVGYLPGSRGLDCVAVSASEDGELRSVGAIVSRRRNPPHPFVESYSRWRVTLSLT